MRQVKSMKTIYTARYIFLPSRQWRVTLPPPTLDVATLGHKWNPSAGPDDETEGAVFPSCPSNPGGASPLPSPSRRASISCGHISFMWDRAVLTYCCRSRSPRGGVFVSTFAWTSVSSPPLACLSASLIYITIHEPAWLEPIPYMYWITSLQVYGKHTDTTQYNTCNGRLRLPHCSALQC